MVHMKMSLIWMLVLLLSSAWGYNAPIFPQSTSLTVAYRETAVLPCDGSAVMDEEDPEVSWEVMGADVAAMNGDSIMIDDRYEGDVRFASEGPKGADFSLILDRVRLSDSNMYQCIWRGGRTLSTVWLTVEHPEVDTVLEVHPHDVIVTLPCYLDLPRNQPPDQLQVWWESDGLNLVEKINNEIISHSGEGFIIPSDADIIDMFPLTILYHLSPRIYHCRYRTKKSEKPKPGIPGTITIITKGNYTENYSDNATEDWSGDWTWDNPPEVDSTPTTHTTDQMPVLLNSVTWSTDGSTTFSPMEAHEETATSYPDGSLPDDPEVSMDWSDFPWVRTGLIAGVLFVTGAALCILGVLHKL